MPALFLLSSLLMIGCYTPPPPLRMTAGSVQLAGTARVELKMLDGEIFKLRTWNDSHDLMVIDRDKVRLETPRGFRRRTPGGAASAYNVAPGATHDLNVKFDLSGLNPGEEIQIRLDEALTIHGQPVKIDPIRLKVANEAQ